MLPEIGRMICVNNEFKSKKDFQECAKELIAPLKPFYITDMAELKYGTVSSRTSEKVQRTEAFIRPLWGLAPLWNGGGDLAGFAEIYREGIINGTDPMHKGYWGTLANGGQVLCESPCIMLSLVLAKDMLWDKFTEKQKDNITTWIHSATGARHPNNNWNFFQVLNHVCLKKLGQPYSQEIIDEKLEMIESFYRGDGWYSDGNLNRKFDYYIAFAFHFYGLIYAKLMETDDPERSSLFKERAMLYAKHFIYWFDETGREVPFGRSLPYRFAHIAFWSACLFAGIEPFSIPVMKGIIARNLRFWMGMPIRDNAGILTVGYGYEQTHMAEEYTCFGSPYWCMKSFLLLALPDSHPVWSAEEAPLPKLDTIHIIKPSNMVVQRINGYTCLLPTGQQGGCLKHSGEKYSKFIYCSKYAFSVPGTYSNKDSAAGDNMLMFEKDGHYFTRNECIDFHVNDDATVFSKWSPFEGVTVSTLIIPTDEGHIRKHTIESDGEYVAYDCGFQTAGKDGDVIGENGEQMALVINPNLNLYEPHILNMKTVKYIVPQGKSEFVTRIVYPQ